MNIPGYDAWRLRGPEVDRSEIMEACEACKGVGIMQDADGHFPCTECDGVGEVLVTLDEPDGDYEYERRHDAAWEDGQ